MTKLWEIRLCGKGGQGLITASVVLAEAAIRCGKNVVQSQSYGPESRGGACKAELIISDSEILYPRINNPNLLFCMSDDALEKYLPTLAEDGFLIIDDIVPKKEIKKRHFRIPITGMAREKLGGDTGANIIALGVIVTLAKPLPESAVADAIHDFFRPNTLDINMLAYTLGLEAGKKYAEQSGESNTGSLFAY